MILLAQRSPVPDLLFEETQAARLAELAPFLDRPEAIDAAAPLHRLTVFLTYRCNLGCAYCKTVPRCRADLDARPARAAAFDLAAFERLLDAHAGTEIRHVHFTGGEASLVRDLPAMIRTARARGVAHTSVTTNGTLPPARYLALVDAGLSEARVSLDAADAAAGDAVAGRRGAWRAAVETVRALAAERRRRAGFYLVVNTVVRRELRAHLPATVAFLLGLGPDDVKLITEVDDRDGPGDLPAAAAARAGVAALLARAPAGAYPLLRRKLRTVFAPDAIGLAGEEAAPGRPWRCLVPLTERTVDATAYYPCSVYLREGGAPLGPLSDPPAAQRARSAAFVRGSDCLADRICRRYCLHCTRTFNARANGRGA